jgi:hypothetical protein
VIHVIPLNDLCEHAEHEGCACGLEVFWRDEDGRVLGEPVCVHSSWDGRELIERAEEIIRQDGGRV